MQSYAEAKRLFLLAHPPSGGVDPDKKPDPPAFKLPDELAGKPPEEVARYYTDKYKDYDDIKTRAGEAESWSKFGKREEVEQRMKTFENVTAALKQGKVIVADEKGMLYARDIKDLTPAEKKQVREQGADAGTGASDWLDGYDDLAPREQASRMEKRVRGIIDEIVAAKEKTYGEAIQGAQGTSTNMINTVLEIQAALQENPSLKLRDILPKMATYAAQGHNNPLKAALDEFLAPAQIEVKAEKRAAEIIADHKLKAEKEKAEKILPTGSPLARMMRGGKRDSGRVTTDQIISGLREKGLLN